MRWLTRLPWCKLQPMCVLVPFPWFACTTRTYQLASRHVHILYSLLHIHTHSHIHTFTHSHAHPHILTYTPSHMQTFTHANLHTHTHLHTLTRTPLHTHLHTHSQMHTFTHLYSCTRNSLGDGHPSVYCRKPLGCCHTDVWGPGLSSTFHYLDKGDRHTDGGWK